MRDPILQFFRYEHLPLPLQEVSKPFCEMAELVADKLPRNPERSVALRKLLEAKDAAVRSSLFRDEFEEAVEAARAPASKRVELG